MSVIRRWNSNAARGRLVWNQLKSYLYEWWFLSINRSRGCWYNSLRGELSKSLNMTWGSKTSTSTSSDPGSDSIYKVFCKIYDDLLANNAPTTTSKAAIFIPWPWWHDDPYTESSSNYRISVFTFDYLTFKNISQENKVHCVSFFFELCHKLRLD